MSVSVLCVCLCVCLFFNADFFLGSSEPRGEQELSKVCLFIFKKKILLFSFNVV